MKTTTPGKLGDGAQCKVVGGTHAGKSGTVREIKTGKTAGGDPIAAYSEAQPPPFRATCDALRKLIDTALPEATSKIWHGSPVWFLDDNPVVGYNSTTMVVNLLFWNGQAFDEPNLKPVGKYRAAQATFHDTAELEHKLIRRWLKEAKSNVFDSKAFFKRLRERK